MKLIIATLLLFATTTSFAQEHTFNAVKQITTSSIEMTNLCPVGARCITDGTSVILNYNVKCSEKLVSFNYETVKTKGKTYVVVSTTTGYTAFDPKDGPFLSCLGMREVTKRIDLIMNFDEIIIKEFK